MNSPLLSILMLYRTPPWKEGYPNRDITKFLVDFNNNFVGLSTDKIELLIKLDEDDAEALKLIPFINSQPYTTKVFVYKKWEGRFSFNYHQLFLFNKINPNTKFIMTLNDDSVFTKKTNGLLEELEQYRDEKYVIFWGTPDTIPVESIILANIDSRYAKDIPYNKICIFSHPVMSKKVIECMGGMWLTFIDDTIGLIIYFLYKNHNVDIVKILQRLVVLRKNNFRCQPHELNASTFNIETQISLADYNPDAYFYELTKQQAKNIYLNMKEEGYIK